MAKSEKSPASGNTLHSFSDALADAAHQVAPTVVAIHARRRIPASGIIWRPGYVVASDHTIRRDQGISISLADGKRVDAVLVGRDPGTDLALLKLPADTATGADELVRRNMETAPLRVGELVLAVGRPGDGITATLGTVHTVGGEWRTWRGGQLAQHIRVDIAVHDGFSGSALVDADGRVVGINTSILTRGAPAVVPAATIDRVVDQLQKSGRVSRGWLGIGTQPIRLTDKVRAETGLTQDVGLLVVGIASDSPAERASLHVGDTLISLAGTATREADDVMTILSPDTVSRTLTARIVRAGALVEIPVVIGESPHRSSRQGGNADSSAHEHSSGKDHYHECWPGRTQAFGPAFIYGFARDCGTRRGH